MHETGVLSSPPRPPADSEPAARRYRVDLKGESPSPPVPESPPAADPPVIRRAERGPRPTIPGTSAGAVHAADPARGGSRRIRLAVDRDTLTLNPGQPAVASVTLDNSGRTVDHFALSVDGVPDAWARGPAHPPQLNPGDRIIVPLTITVPRIAESLAGEYPVTIRATSREDPGESGTATATWTVLPFAQSVMSLAPSRARAWRRAAFKATIRNQGNAAAVYGLSSSDEEQVLRCAFGGQQLPVGAGETASARFTATAPLRWVGSAEVRPFTVRAEPAATGAGRTAPEPPLTAQGQFVHRALIPTWLPPLLLVAAVALWYWLRQRTEIVVSVSPPAAQVAIGTTARMAAQVANQQGEQVPGGAVVWSSSDTGIAQVSDSGVVLGVGEGSAVITAASGRKRATAQVSVVAARVAQLTVTPRRLTLRAGSSALLRSVARDAGGAQLPRDATWQSSDPTVITVGETGASRPRGRAAPP